jgi:MGT family glycosyltransferase
MARILIATVPVLGHLAPLLPIARSLVTRGHDVRWYSGAKYRARIEATGARPVGYTRARDYDDAKLDEAVPGRAELRGLAQLKQDMKFFIDCAPGQLDDLRALLDSFPAAVVLHDPTMLGGIFSCELGGPPSVVLGVLPLVVSSVDAPPFGLGLQPSATALGRLRNRALHWLVRNVIFRNVQTHWNQTRAGVGLPPTGWWMDHAVQRTAFYLQPSVPGFEYPRSDLPEKVRFIGPIAPDQSPVPPPPFWAELDGTRPIIHVTQGTLANTKPSLIAPALEALADEDVLVVVSTGNRPIEQLALGTLPKNARVATFLSYPDLLPKTSVMVTNGGYGGVQMALSHGVPLVVAGASEDKPEVAARVAWSGTGINLKTATPSPDAIRTAVRAILANPSYRSRAGALATEYRAHDPITRTVDLLESLASTPSQRRADFPKPTTASLPRGGRSARPS